jgi:hypothetical protein
MIEKLVGKMRILVAGRLKFKFYTVFLMILKRDRDRRVSDFYKHPESPQTSDQHPWPSLIK